jgi:uncharacterized protein (TIGR02147 family)
MSILKPAVEQLKEHLVEAHLSMRKLAKLAGVSAPLLSQVVAGKKSLTLPVAKKLAAALELSPYHRKQFVEGARMQRSSNASHKARALRTFARSKAFAKTHPAERQLFEYFYEWYLPVLREAMRTGLSQITAEDISQRLLFSLTPDQVKKGLATLERFGLIKQGRQGGWLQAGSASPSIDGDVYRLALARFHDQAAQHSIESITKVPRSGRLLEGAVIALSASEWAEVQQTLSSALREIVSRSKSPTPKTDVYHVGIYAFQYTNSALDRQAGDAS